MKNKKRAFIVVGHSSWGKSQTMLALKGKKRKSQYIKIADIWFLTRTRSNDDIRQILLDMVRDIIERNVENIIIVLCPVFDRADERYAGDILRELFAHYEMYFFVLHKKYGKEEYIEIKETDKLEKYGKVKVYKDSENATERAKALIEFVESNI